MLMMEKVLANLSQAMEASADAAGETQTDGKNMAVAFAVFMNAIIDPVEAGYVDAQGNDDHQPRTD